jgi:hypothetical protein
MEKYVVFGPIVIFFGIFFLLIIGFILFVVKLIFKSKNASWQGKVVDKKHNTRRDYDSNRIEHFYVVVVETTDGKTMKLGLAKQKYDEFKIGDKIKKEKGKLFPEKTS